jgi:hypothetical protein
VPNLSSPSARSQILDAIDHEIEIAKKPAVFVVESSERIGPLWQVALDAAEGSLRGLDEALEGCAAWWSTPEGQENGTGDVLAAVPESEAITLRFCNSAPPGPGGKIFIYPPLYLDSLRESWLHPEWSESALAWGRAVVDSNAVISNWALSPGGFPWLRNAQREAFALPGWRAGFLWGPPGTGKTTTLGAVLSKMLVQHPSTRILLTSTTNSAVDIALVKVDEALERLATGDPVAGACRTRCKRVGNHFIARNYDRRAHLLPTVDESLVRRMVELEICRPDPSDTLAYAAWKGEVEHVRSLMRDAAIAFIGRPGVIAMTTTRALFTLEDLSALPPFDLLVFDEASQVSLPHALALAPLARNIVFAGDPKQLSPIVQSKHPTTREWLGDSGFALMDEEVPATCFLDEQSRMAPAICDIVSKTFYGGRLRVATDALDDPAWVKHRKLSPDRNAEAVHVGSEGVWSAKYGGYVRSCSADEICEIVARLVGFEDRDSILVLTPYRAQRALLRVKLRYAKLKVQVSTVHRAQGSERDIVIFDCSHADNPFLSCEEGARLINVALSRAKKQLVVLWSDGDRANKLMDRIVGVLNTQDLAKQAKDVAGFCRRRDFPSCMVGHAVRIGTVTCEVVGIREGGARFVATDLATGMQKTFVTDHVRKKFSC